MLACYVPQQQKQKQNALQKEAENGNKSIQMLKSLLLLLYPILFDGFSRQGSVSTTVNIIRTSWSWYLVVGTLHGRDRRLMRPFVS